MAKESTHDLFHHIREAVNQTLEMAEAKSKIPEDTKEMLSQLILTRRGDGEVMLDVGALQRMKAAENQWVDKDRNEQDRLVNPTRLPQLVHGLSGLSSGQYLSFVQRPLERDGANAPFLEAAALRLVDQYSAKEKVAERNKLFGSMQRYVAKTLIDAVLAKEHNVTDQGKLDQLREQTPPQQQFEMAAKALNITTGEVMNVLFKYAVALTLIERIKAKAVKIRQSKEAFEKVLRRLANTDCGPTAKSRIKEIFLGFNKELDLMGKEYAQLPQELQPVLTKLAKDNFEKSFHDLHRAAARLDAISTRWIIIIGEANNPDKTKTDVERIKGMHKVFTH